jgi:hypothetical protein
MAARIAMIAMTISSSTRVKPLSSLVFILVIVFNIFHPNFIFVNIYKIALFRQRCLIVFSSPP